MDTHHTFIKKRICNDQYFNMYSPDSLAAIKAVCMKEDAKLGQLKSIQSLGFHASQLATAEPDVVANLFLDAEEIVNLREILLVNFPATVIDPSWDGRSLRQLLTDNGVWLVEQPLFKKRDFLGFPTKSETHHYMVDVASKSQLNRARMNMPQTRFAGADDYNGIRKLLHQMVDNGEVVHPVINQFVTNLTGN